MLVATRRSRWQDAGCEASFSERSLGKSVYCNPSESRISNEIFSPTLDRKNSSGKGMSRTGMDKILLASLRFSAFALNSSSGITPVHSADPPRPAKNRLNSHNILGLLAL
jgi:hypothetical protein